MSLEEIFLHLTTEDSATQGTPHDAPPDPSAQPGEAVHA